jgi:exopolyphosphatase/guanosine-5'-triphosphate,3'-diphosphate pyrophosphatase
VATLAVGLYRQFSDGAAAASEAEEQAPQFLDWAAKLHEIGITVAYSGYNRHSAYILRNADMPGFSRAEQERLAGLVLAHRRSLHKILPELEAFEDWREVMALRLAALFYRSRSDTALPDIRAKAKSRSFRVKVDRDWLKKNPLTVAALREEIEEWAAVGIALEVKVLDEIEAPSDLALVG